MYRLLLPLLLLSTLCLAQEVVLVTTKPVRDLQYHPERSAPAEVVPLNDARLSAEINARVLQIPVRVGDTVTAGDLLVSLDCREYASRHDAQKATRRALESRIRLARTQLTRAKDLKQKRNISQEEVDRRETELLTLRAELAAQKEAETQAALNLERCQVTAPFQAVVKERLASVGTLAAPGTPLLHLVQLDDSEISAQVRPLTADEGAAADSIEFSYLGRRYPLHTLRALPVVDPKTRSVEVRLGFDGDSAPPGASGRIHWRAAAPYLPADLLLRREDSLGVFLLEKGRARFHTLADAREGQPARTDLPADSQLIVEGRHRLQDGDAVEARLGHLQP